MRSRVGESALFVTLGTRLEARNLRTLDPVGAEGGCVADCAWVVTAGGGVEPCTGGGGGSTGSVGGAGVGTAGSDGSGGAGDSGADGTVTVGRLTDGGGWSWPRLVPAHAPRSASVVRRKGTGRIGICARNGQMARVVSVRRRMRNDQNVGRDLYEALGVRRDADAATITRAYRALARELHPDAASDGDTERFREVTEAYEVLSNARSRRLYDRLGWRGRGGGIESRPGAARVYASNPREFLEDLESVIATALGRSPERQPTRVVGEVQLDAYEARLGATCSIGESGTVTVPPKTSDLDRVYLGPEKVAIVRIVPPRERVAIRLAATIALVAAVGFLLFLLAL